MSLPTIKITCGGRPLPDHIEVLDLEIDWAINRVPQATLTLLDGSLPDRRFEISDAVHLYYGKTHIIVCMVLRHPYESTHVTLR